MCRLLTEAWGQFLGQFEWDWFVSLTFREEVPTFRAHRLVRWYTSDLEKAAGVPIFWFRADEYGERLGRFHIHLLIGNVGHLRRLNWMDEWNRRAGYARILPFEKTKGAAFYCAKYVTKQFGDWDLSDNLRAFRQYQPSLPLNGTTKWKESTKDIVSSAEAKKPTRKTHPLNQKQARMPFMSEDQKTGLESAIMNVYKDEVTRGKGRFRRFFIEGQE